MKIPKTFIPEKNLERNIEHLLFEKAKTNYKGYYKNLEIERVKMLELYFDRSLDCLRKNGYERHIRPWEYFSLIIDYYEGKLRTGLAGLAKNVLGYGGWFSMAVKIEGDKLICYVDPENIRWDNVNDRYIVKGMLKYSDKKELDITGIPSEEWVNLREFDDEFIEYFYTRRLKDLPEEMLKDATALGQLSGVHVYLPPSGILRPIGYGIPNMLDIKAHFVARVSRGVRVKNTRK